MSSSTFIRKNQPFYHHRQKNHYRLRRNHPHSLIPQSFLFILPILHYLLLLSSTKFTNSFLVGVSTTRNTFLSHLTLPSFRSVNKHNQDRFIRSSLAMLSEGEEKDTSAQFEENRKTIDFADICIIGGGASGLSAAIAASDVFRREFDNTQSDKEEGTKKGIGESDDSSGGSDGVRTDNRLRRKIVILESNKKTGGRLSSLQPTHDGFVLDEGFAVFLEAYPLSQKILGDDGCNDNNDDNYMSLELGRFVPGAIVYGFDVTDPSIHTRIADPFRRVNKRKGWLPFLVGMIGDLVEAVRTPLATRSDKLRMLRLVLDVKTPSVEWLKTNTVNKSLMKAGNDKDSNDRGNSFEDTLSILRIKYGFSKRFVDSFWSPFLGGVFLCPDLADVSWGITRFVLRMFLDGYVALPRGGMGSVGKRLEEMALSVGDNGDDGPVKVEIRTGRRVCSMEQRRMTLKEQGDGSHQTWSITYKTTDGRQDRHHIYARTVIVATDMMGAARLTSTIESQPRSPTIRDDAMKMGTKIGTETRRAGCLYYSFRGDPPIQEPILILNGDGRGGDGDPLASPINTLCFPSTVGQGYAPQGFSLCSVSLRDGVLDFLPPFVNGNDNIADGANVVDDAVRRQLASWFPTCRDDVLDTENWLRRGLPIVLANAGPRNQYFTQGSTMMNKCDFQTFPGNNKLPPGMKICGDHYGTPTLDGALETGMDVGRETALDIVSTQKSVESGESRNIVKDT